MNNLLEHVERSIQARKLFRRGGRILVAVSGGVDSMFLLRLMCSLAPKFGWKLVVAHFNHQLRGRASDGDEQFVNQSAKKLGLKAVVGRGNVKALAKRRGLSIEMAARELRHEFLAAVAERLEARSIALAHHADDQVELFFLRLLRGAGGEGIAGIKWRSPSPADSEIQLVRPLLDVGKCDLEEFARENRIRFREDSSNVSQDILRNRIRHELLPLIGSHYQPALAKTVLRTMEIIGAETEFVAATARTWLEEKRHPKFERLPVAVQRQCLRLQLVKLDVSPDFDLIEQLRMKPDKPVTVSPVLQVAMGSGGIVRARTQTPTAFNLNEIGLKLNGRGGKMVFDGVRCFWKVRTATDDARTRQMAAQECFDADEVGLRIVLRHWRAGDRFQPIGMPAPVKLQDWFMNQKVPRARRHELLVAESASGKIFWVEGLRISEKFKLTPRTRRLLVWNWRRN